MISLRDEIRRAYGVEGAYSLTRDVLGYLRGRMPPGETQSLRQHLDLISGPHLDLDIILVGVETFDNTDRNRIDRSLAEARRLLAPGGIGIKRVFHGAISTADTEGLETIDNEKQSKELRRNYSGPNPRAIDVFYVQELNLGGARGIARRNLSRHSGCDKRLRNTVGCILDVRFTSGSVLAHELGHHLTLKHHDDPFNVMHRGANGTNFTSGQYSDMIDHCSMRGT